MDELELQRRCIVAPHERDQERDQALADHPAARERLRQARQFDDQLRFVLHQPALPEGLNERILLHTELRNRRRRRRQLLAGLAVAASLLLSSQLSLQTPRQAQPPADTASFEQIALAHVHAEMHHLEHPPGQVSSSRVRQMFADYGARLEGSLGTIQLAYVCPTAAGEALHLIVDNAAGRVTLLFLPQTSTALRAAHFSDQRFVGRTLLTGGGALALIGEQPQALELMQQSLQQALSWPALQAPTAPPGQHA